MNELDDLAAHIGEGGFTNPCEANHGEHATKNIYTGNTMTVFDWQLYANTVGFCPGDDAISQQIEREGFWERHVSEMAMQILDQKNHGDSLFIDVGAQIGWYSVMALQRGWPTLAIEANDECARVLTMNAERHAGGTPFALCQRWMGPTLHAYDGQTKIKLLKCDIEGSEEHAFHVFQNHFRAWMIDYAIMEISPVFNDSYPAMITELLDMGYTAYRIDQLHKHDRWTLENLEEKLAEFTQVDLVFTSPLAETVIR